MAQYRTESWDLVPGWNAIYLNIDPGDDPLEIALAGDLDITEVWQWRPGGLDPSLDPALTTSTGADEWKVWRRDDLANSTFNIFSPHAAYAILTTSAQTFTLKGKVIVPRVRWRTDGSNLVGFPINGQKQLSDYLTGSGIVGSNTEVYRYVGGDMSENNPALAPANLIQAKRGEAFWIRSHKFSDFYGPVSVDIALDSGLDFGAGGSLKRLVIRNRTDDAISVAVSPIASEAAPGESTAPTAPTLLTRERDATSGLFNYSPFGAGTNLTIPPRDSVGLSLSVDRSVMPGAPGAQFAGLLRVTDGGGLTDIYLPVTAEKASLAGLWVGEARISRVQNQLQRFQRDEDGDYLVDGNGKYVPEYERDGNGDLVLDGGGSPIPVGDQDLNATAQEFKLRLILHVNAAGTATLLSRAYAGIISDDGAGTTLTGIATEESFLHASHLATAVRLSTSHLPTDFVQEMSGSLAPSASLTTTVSLGANHPSNPFLHIYHPDHDNKDARFENPALAGTESHAVNRAITLALNAAAGPGDGPEWGTSLLSGTFSETVTGIHKKPIAATGIFAIGKVSDIAVLQTP